MPGLPASYPVPTPDQRYDVWPLDSTQAIASCATLTAFDAAKAASASTRARFFFKVFALETREDEIGTLTAIGLSEIRS